jgi:hypothetical protein
MHSSHLSIFLKIIKDFVTKCLTDLLRDGGGAEGKLLQSYREAVSGCRELRRTDHLLKQTSYHVMSAYCHLDKALHISQPVLQRERSALACSLPVSVEEFRNSTFCITQIWSRNAWLAAFWHVVSDVELSHCLTNSTPPWTHPGEWMYRLRFLEIGGEWWASCPSRFAPVSFGYDAGWTPEPVWERERPSKNV